MQVPKLQSSSKAQAKRILEKSHARGASKDSPWYIADMWKSESQRMTAKEDGGSGARDRSGISIDGLVGPREALRRDGNLSTAPCIAYIPHSAKTEVDESGKRTGPRARAFVFCRAIGGRPIGEQRALRSSRRTAFCRACLQENGSGINRLFSAQYRAF